MSSPRALTSTLRSVIALLTALLISVVGATALPAAALAGNSGQAKGHQADRAEKPGKAHQQGKTQQSKAHTASKSRSNGKTQERGSSAKAQKPAKAQQPAKTQKPAKTQETQPARGQSAQAHQSKTSNKTSSGASAKSGDTSGDKGDPKGNNGTVKLAGFGGTNGPGHSSGDGSTPMHPSNDPHLPCGFSVEWFGFDSGVTSAVTFEQHAPTRGGSAHHDSVPLDNDSHAGGGSTAGYDGVANYNLDFEGEPHPKHGYHVKLTTETPYSQGSDRKHKVFWVEPCDEETPDEETPDEETPTRRRETPTRRPPTRRTPTTTRTTRTTPSTTRRTTTRMTTRASRTRWTRTVATPARWSSGRRPRSGTARARRPPSSRPRSRPRSRPA